MHFCVLFAFAFALPAILALPQQGSPVAAPQPSKRHELEPKPSKKPGHGNRARAPEPSRRAKRADVAQESLVDTTGADIDYSRYLCPVPTGACPIEQMAVAPQSLSEWHNVGFECLDFANELRSCGGCTSLGQGIDCSALPGVRHATCANGQCVVQIGLHA